ncbi:Hypothetical predicted protein [Olea europaea subsp. europaea]|uniref:Uncharacterized protein n=1 Tax=Olea europaea subsp. europaea TaxID=158383 RepID=A0A8S0SK79_OLEEU|nr:Hypothetical predicted protein [Olea europaea subsp. europaea]
MRTGSNCSFLSVDLGDKIKVSGRVVMSRAIGEGKDSELEERREKKKEERREPTVISEIHIIATSFGELSHDIAETQ